MTEETTEERTERTERPAAPRFSESESPPAWLIATRGDLRELEFRVNTRIDDAKADVIARIDDAKANTRSRADVSKPDVIAGLDDIIAGLDELKEQGRAEDAKLAVISEALARIEARQKYRDPREYVPIWIGIAVAAAAIIAGIILRIAAG